METNRGDAVEGKEEHGGGEDHDRLSWTTRPSESVEGQIEQPVDVMSVHGSDSASASDEDVNSGEDGSSESDDMEDVDPQQFGFAAASIAHADKAQEQASHDIDDGQDGDEQMITITLGSKTNKNTSSGTSSDEEQKKMLKELAKYQRHVYRQMHQLHLLCLIAHVQLCNSVANSEIVRSTCLSLANPTEQQEKLNWKAVTNIAKQLSQAIRLMPPVNESHVDLEAAFADPGPTVEESVINSMANHRGTQRDISIAILAALRAVGAEARLVGAFWPLPIRPQKAEQVVAPSVPTKRRRSSKVAASSASASSVDASSRPKRRKSTAEKPIIVSDSDDDAIKASFFFAVEVLAGTGKSRGWRRVISDHSVPRDPDYALAVDESGHIRDVTANYNDNYARTSRLASRAADAWVERALKPYVQPDKKEEDKQEKKQLDETVRREKMPTTLKALKHHRLYVVEKHLRQNEIIHPKEPVLGYCRGEPVYPRENVRVLRSEAAWLKLGMAVKPSEQPVRAAKPRRSSTGADADSASPESVSLENGLYGDWQVKKYTAPPVVDGKIPTNAHDTVDLFQPWMLPSGAVLLKDMPGILGVARKLGISAADSVVDFEFTGGRMVPVKGGVVVPAACQEIVVSAWLERTSDRAIKENQERENRVLKNWLQLTKKLLIRQRLRDEAAQRRADGASSSAVV